MSLSVASVEDVWVGAEERRGWRRGGGLTGLVVGPGTGRRERGRAASLVKWM